jgi:hypothetical protein
MSYSIVDYQGITVTADSDKRPTQVIYYSDVGKTVELETFNITYSSTNDDPIYLGETLHGHVFNITRGCFEVQKVSVHSSIESVTFTPVLFNVVETATDTFNMPWSSPPNYDIGKFVPRRGTAPFTYAISVDADSKFQLVNEYLQLSAHCNYFLDTTHSVTVVVTDFNTNTFTITLTFNLITGSFWNLYSFNFFEADNQFVRTDDPGADATTTFSISIWASTLSEDNTYCGRWDASTDCHWVLGNTNNTAIPELWVSGDGTPTLGANVQNHVAAAATILSQGWYNVCFTFNAGTIHCYINSVLSDGASGGTPQASMFSSATERLQIGRVGLDPQSNGTWDGKMNNFSFWSVELSLAEVQELYNSGTPTDLAAHSQQANLLEWYRLGDDASDADGGFDQVGGTNFLDYRNDMTFKDISTSVPSGFVS